MSDSEFIKALQSGKSEAYSHLIDQFQGKVFATCLSFIPNQLDAEDVVQEVFVEIFRSVHKFKGNSKISTWIYRITTNKCLEFIRKRTAKKRTAIFKKIDESQTPLDKTNFFTEFNHPGVLLENQESTEAIYRAINELPESQKVVFTLAKLDGKSYQEIVEITGKSLSSVESVMFRAKKNLKLRLENFYKHHK